MGGNATILQGVIASPAGGAAPARLDKALSDLSGLSRERVKALIEQGKVELAGAPASSASAKPMPGTAWRIAVPEATPATAQPQDIPLSIAYEDEFLIVVNKPAGLVVHPAAGNLDGTLVDRKSVV